MSPVKRIPSSTRSADPELGPYSIEVGPNTDAGYVRHLEHSAAALRPSIVRQFQGKPSTLWLLVWRPLLVRMGFLDAPTSKNDLAAHLRSEREIAMRVAAMVQAGVPLEAAEVAARRAPVAFTFKENRRG